MKRYASRLRKCLWSGTHQVLALADQLLPTGSDQLAQPVIFVIGPPRSGTTLIYEALVSAFDVGYFANIHHRYFRAPAMVERLWRVSSRRRTHRFESKFGTIKGSYSPSECWEFWYRFFPRSPHHVRSGQVDDESLRTLRQEFCKLARITQRPFLIKNLPCGMRIEPIREALPEAVFIVVHRNTVDNALSILKAREQEVGNVSTWCLFSHPMSMICDNCRFMSKSSNRYCRLKQKSRVRTQHPIAHLSSFGVRAIL